MSEIINETPYTWALETASVNSARTVWINPNSPLPSQQRDTVTQLVQRKRDPTGFLNVLGRNAVLPLDNSMQVAGVDFDTIQIWGSTQRDYTPPRQVSC